MRIQDKRDKELFQRMALKYNLPLNEIRAICHYPFVFARKVVEDDNDTKALFFNYLLTLKLKRAFATDKSLPYYTTKEAVFKNKLKKMAEHDEKIKLKKNNEHK